MRLMDGAVGLAGDPVNPDDLTRTMSSRMRSKEETDSRGIQSLPSAVEVHSGCSARLTTRVIMPPGGSNAQHFTLPAGGRQETGESCRRKRSGPVAWCRHGVKHQNVHGQWYTHGRIELHVTLQQVSAGCKAPGQG